jgi:hypothetical protein
LTRESIRIIEADKEVMDWLDEHFWLPAAGDGAGARMLFRVWRDKRKFEAQTTADLLAKGIVLEEAVTITEGLHDGLGGAFVPVDFYDRKFLSFVEDGLLEPRACPNTCLVGAPGTARSASTGEAKAAAAGRLADGGVADAGGIVGGAVRATVVAPSLIMLAFPRDVAGADLAARCLAAASAEPLYSLGLYGFIDGRADERIVTKRTHGGSAVSLAVFSRFMPYTWHSRRAGFLIGSFEGVGLRLRHSFRMRLPHDDAPFAPKVLFVGLSRTVRLAHKRDQPPQPGGDIRAAARAQQPGAAPRGWAHHHPRG